MQPRKVARPLRRRGLPRNWHHLLVKRDVQEVADFALTLYYKPVENFGIGGAWLALSETISEEAAQAMLGTPLGPLRARFDPGRMGSYFQTPAMVGKSVEMLSRVTQPAIRSYQELLQQCAAEKLGVYVTF